MGIYRQSRVGYSDFLSLETFEMINMTRMQMVFSFFNMNKLFILKSSEYWKVISENKGRRRRISDVQKYLKTKFPWLQTIFFIFKHPKICISNSSVF
jgi:hypothetical protein